MNHPAFHLAAMLAACIANPAAAESPASTVWFEVAATDAAFRESYLLPLTDPAAIAQARAWLAQGEASGTGAIVVAKIRAGGDGLNRNLRDPDAPRWSWHVSGFVEFADLAIEICDGWPGFVEEDPEAFVANTDATICFWGYRLRAELSEAPRMALDDALDGLWHNPATSGQGFAFDVLPEQNVMVGGWFTWRDPARGESAGQRWYTVAGQIEGDTAHLAVAEPQGGRFNDSAPVTVAEAGAMRITFVDCNRAVAEVGIGEVTPVTIPLHRMQPSFGCGRR